MPLLSPLCLAHCRMQTVYSNWDSFLSPYLEACTFPAPATAPTTGSSALISPQPAALTQGGIKWGIVAMTPLSSPPQHPSPVPHTHLCPFPFSLLSFLFLLVFPSSGILPRLPPLRLPAQAPAAHRPAAPDLLSAPLHREVGQKRFLPGLQPARAAGPSCTVIFSMVSCVLGQVLSYKRQ